MTKQLLQQFHVQMEIPQRGPRGGYREPVFRSYGVCAFSREEALEVFRQEMTIPEGATLTASSTLSRVIRAF